MSNPHNFGTLTGRLTADPKVFKDTVANFTLAVDYAGNNRDNKDDRTGFFDCVYFFGDATPDERFIKRQITEGKLKKGSAISVSYSLSQDKWSTDDGAKRSAIRLRVDGMKYVGYGEPRQSSSSQSGGDTTISVPDQF